MKQTSSVGERSTRHCSDISEHIIHNRKDQRCTSPADQCVFNDVSLCFYLMSPHCIDDNNRKYQTCRTIQCIIPFYHSLEERNLFVYSLRNSDASILNWTVRRFFHKNAGQKDQYDTNQKYRCQIFSDHIDYLLRITAQIICEPEENSRHEQRYPPYIWFW